MKVNLFAARERAREGTRLLCDRAFWGYFLQVLLGIAIAYVLLLVRLRPAVNGAGLLDAAGAAVILLAAVGAFRVWRHARDAEGAARDGAWRSAQARLVLRGAVLYLVLAAGLAGLYVAADGTAVRSPLAPLRAAAVESALAAAASLIGLWRWNVYRRWLRDD